MITEQETFAESRRHGIGGSDMAAILGLSPYKQAIDVFYEKRPDLAAREGYQDIVVGGDAVDFGHLVEPAVAKLYEKRTGKKVRQQHQTQEHRDYSYLRANIDRRVTGEKRGLEIKTVNWRLADRWGESGSDEIADYYLPQVHHYMLVMDWPMWDVAALIGGASDFRIYTVERDKEWDQMIIAAAADFWDGVERGIAPPIDWEKDNAPEVIKRVYTNIEGERQLSERALELHWALQQISEHRKNYQIAERVLKDELQARIGNAGIGRIPGLPGGYVRKWIKVEAKEVAAYEYIKFYYSSRVK